ncbi:MAG: aspartate carbamoyltransferase [Actinomycetota bacterium]
MAAGSLWWATRGDSQVEARRADVAAKGAAVMPFDLNKTTHVFEKNGTGGVESVTANDPADTEQIELIRGHLQNERTKFARGDFDDPAAIHGMDMPGLAALRAGASRVRVEYASTSDGARLTFSSTEPQLVQGMHDWFDAQTSDHG